MPIPLSSNEIIHVDHKIKEASYSMPHMQAASDHYMLGYLVSGDRKWFSYENIKIAHSGDVGISKPNVYHRNCAMSDIHEKSMEACTGIRSSACADKERTDNRDYD